MKRIAALAVWASFILLVSGCARLALRMSPPLVTNMASSIFEECDPQLAREAIPATLKMLEGLSKTDPGNRTIQTALSKGFAGYALLFLEEGEPERASGFYIRARDCGLRALGAGGEGLSHPERQAGASAALQALGREDLEPLFWAAFSWNAWINLNLDKPEALAQLGASQAMAERVLAIDSSYLFGLPETLQGAMLSAKPQHLGGDRERARSLFQRGLDRGEGRFFPAAFYYARYYAVAAQERELFRRLLRGVVSGDPRALREMCLVNTVFQQKAVDLLAREDELFY